MAITRLTAAAIAAICVAVLLFVLPNQVEHDTYSRVKPIHLPFAALVVMALCALAMVFEQESGPAIEPRFLIKLSAIIGLSIAALFALKFIPFQYSMPVFAGLVMLLVGERRWPWLAVGVVIPVVIWVLVEIVLGRPLP